MITRNRVGIALAFVLAGITLVGGPMAIAQVVHNPAIAGTSAVPTPAASESAPSESAPSEPAPSEPETTEPSEPEYSVEPDATDPVVTGPEDFTTAQDAKFMANMEIGLPTLVARVDEDTLTALGRQAAYVLDTGDATEEQVVEVFTDNLTNYDDTDGWLFVTAVQQSYLA